jgi:hypothetical protein
MELMSKLKINEQHVKMAAPLKLYIQGIPVYRRYIPNQDEYELRLFEDTDNGSLIRTKESELEEQSKMVLDAIHDMSETIPGVVINVSVIEDEIIQYK